jgi:hypothetical protein
MGGSSRIFGVAKPRLNQFMDKNRVLPCTHVKEVMVAINEDNIRDRKKRVRSNMQIQQLHKFQLISNKKMENMVPDRKLEKHQGSTRGNLIAFVHVPAFESMWSLPRDVRNKVYHRLDGSRRVSSGNAADDAEPSGEEPTCAFFHAMPTSVWQDLGTAFQAKGFLDLSAGSGEVAKAALLLKKRRPQ